MTSRETLHQLVDELPEDQVDVARGYLEDLRDAIDDDEPLDAPTLKALDEAMADVAAGNFITLEEYERHRDL